MTMNTRPLSLALALACAAPLLAAGGADAKTMKSAPQATADARFLNTTEQGNAKELDIASLAVDRATSAGVRDFARRLVADHQALHGKLVATASSVGVSLSARGMGMAMGDMRKNEKGMTSSERAARGGGGSASTMSMPADPELRALSNRQGADFDRAFTEQMIADHQKEIARFQLASNDKALSASVRSLASATLPTLREHLAAAQALRTAK
jgi:putative membrane protein